MLRPSQSCDAEALRACSLLWGAHACSISNLFHDKIGPRTSFWLSQSALYGSIESPLSGRLSPGMRYVNCVIRNFQKILVQVRFAFSHLQFAAVWRELAISEISWSWCLVDHPSCFPISNMATQQNFSTNSYSRGPMSLNMSLETFKHLIRFSLIIGIASSVSAIFPGHEPSRGYIVHIDLVSDSPQTTCPQAAPLYPDRHSEWPLD